MFWGGWKEENTGVAHTVSVSDKMQCCIKKTDAQKIELYANEMQSKPHAHIMPI